MFTRCGLYRALTLGLETAMVVRTGLLKNAQAVAPIRFGIFDLDADNLAKGLPRACTSSASRPTQLEGPEVKGVRGDISGQLQIVRFP